MVVAFLPDFPKLLGKFLGIQSGTMRPPWVNSSVTTALEATISKIDASTDLEAFGGLARTSHSSPLVFFLSRRSST